MKIKKIETDLLEQFRNRKNISAICDALDKQMAALAEAFTAIAYETDIDTAVGVQLDRIGNIVGLTRSEAGVLCGQTGYFDIVDDELYRKYLKYKAFRNSCDCTYQSIITAMRAILGNDAKINYEEDEDFPATLILDVRTNGEDEVFIGGIPPIKPAGVNVEYKVDTRGTIEVSHIKRYYVSGLACGTMYCGEWPKDKPFPRCGAWHCGEYPPEGI